MELTLIGRYSHNNGKKMVMVWQNQEDRAKLSQYCTSGKRPFDLKNFYMTPPMGSSHQYLGAVCRVRVRLVNYRFVNTVGADIAGVYLKCISIIHA